MRARLVCFWYYEERVHSDLPNTPEFWLVHDVLGEREVGVGGGGGVFQELGWDYICDERGSWGRRRGAIAKSARL